MRIEEFDVVDFVGDIVSKLTHEGYTVKVYKDTIPERAINNVGTSGSKGSIIVLVEGKVISEERYEGELWSYEVEMSLSVYTGNKTVGSQFGAKINDLLGAYGLNVTKIVQNKIVENSGSGVEMLWMVLHSESFNGVNYLYKTDDDDLI